MIDETALIGRIYEAAVTPASMPRVLEDVATASGAQGAILMMRSATGVRWVASPALAEGTQAFMDQGWLSDPVHAAPLLAELHPGFCAETRYRSVEEIERLPVHREFFAPRGLIAGAGTVVQGAQDDLLHIAVEGFASHPASEAALPRLDRLRPHLARAASLASLAREAETRAYLRGLEAAGVAAASIRRDGRLGAANALFEARVGDRASVIGGRLRFADAVARARLAEALAVADPGRTVSLAIHRADGSDAFALHLIPMTGSGRELVDGDEMLLFVAEARNAALPEADLLRLLFDLTPAEARLARRLLDGAVLKEAARALGVSEATARVQLRGVFAKTGAARQSDLMRLLSRVLPVPSTFA